MRDADERTVLKRTIEAARYSIVNRSQPSSAKVCIPILISTGEKPNRATEQMVWASEIGLASTAGQAGRLSYGTAKGVPLRIAAQTKPQLTRMCLRGRERLRFGIHACARHIRRLDGGGSPEPGSVPLAGELHGGPIR